MCKNEVIYKGLLLSSLKGSRFYSVVEGCTNSLVEKDGVLTLTYVKGSTSWSLSDFLGIPKIGMEMEMEPTFRPIRFSEVTVSLNGMVKKNDIRYPHCPNCYSSGFRVSGSSGLW